jgi:Beta-1,3-glucanase
MTLTSRSEPRRRVVAAIVTTLSLVAGLLVAAALTVGIPAPANYYAQFWHQNAINGLAYGFPYDDDAGQSSDISVANPQYMVVAVGW